MKNWVTWVLFLVAFVYNILDVHQTKMLISFGAYEVNPIMDYFIRVHGINSLFVVKIVLFACLGSFLLIHSGRNRGGL